jgi:hypothetical protein
MGGGGGRDAKLESRSLCLSFFQTAGRDYKSITSWDGDGNTENPMQLLLSLQMGLGLDEPMAKR